MSICLVLAGFAWMCLPGKGPAQTFLGKDAVTWEKELNFGKEDRVRRNAAFALGKLGSAASGTVGSLKKKLREDSSASVREAVAFALGEIGKESLKTLDDPDVIQVVIAGLKDADPLVRRSAALALGNFGSSAKAALPALEALLGDPSPAVRQNVAWSLGRLGPAAVPILRKALQNNNEDLLVRRDAVVSLGLVEGEAARPALPELLACCQANNSQLRLAALNVLIKLVGPEDTKAAAAIRQALTDPDLEVKQNAALALANIGGPEAAAAIPVLLDALKQTANADLRRQAVAALYNIGPDAHAAVPVLIETLTSPDQELRRNAALALGGIGPKAEAAIPALVKMIANPQEGKDGRIEAAVALSRMGSVEPAKLAVPTLVAVLENPQNDTQIRERIIWALRVHNIGLREMPAVFPAFNKVLSETKAKETRMLRYDCAYMLGVLQGPDAPDKALDTLLDFLRDDSILIFRGKDVKAGATGEETKGGAATVKEEGKDDGRVMAVQALGRIGTERVVRRNDIVEQLRLIAGNKSTLPDLREKTKGLLAKLGK